MLMVRTMPGAVTVAVVCDQYLAHVREINAADWQRNNYARVDLALRPVRDLYGPQPAADFGPKKLQAVRVAMLKTGRLCRREINERVRLVVAAFTWAVAEEMAPAGLAHGLAAVAPLKKGQHGAREGREVGPVERWVVDATLPHLSRPVAALIEIMWWTGARPSELFRLRPRDIDRSGTPWVARLEHHKNSHRGKLRELHFGPRAREILTPFLLRRGAGEPLFSPAEAVAEMEPRKRQERKTPLYASHLARYEREKAARPDRVVGETYDAGAVRKAVQRAVAAANRERREQGVQLLPDWHPYQLRHAAAGRIQAALDLEAVRVALGHSDAEMSMQYARRDLAKAAAVMEEAG
ncbi:MAG: site-specific integrase [Planctomycetes bacterium]|nr:site-specific integrase [Planctomycetota bacterium]